MKQAKRSISKGQTMRFEGTSCDGGVCGSMPVIVIDEHSNRAEVTHVDAGREYANGFTHIRKAVVERPAHKDRPARQFEVHTFSLREAR